MKTKKDNLPAIVAMAAGLIFVLVSVVIIFTTDVTAKETPDTTQDQQASSTGLWDTFTVELNPNTGSQAGTTTPSQQEGEGEITRADTQNTESSQAETSQPNSQASTTQSTQDDAETNTDTVESSNDFTDYRRLDEEISDESPLADRITNRDRLFGGEAVITNFDVRDQGNVRAGQTNDVADIRFAVDDGDVLAERVDISFVPTGDDGDDQPWEVIEKISIESGRETVASVSADSEDDWIDDGSDYDGPLSGDEKFRIRLSGLNAIIEENDTADLSINVTAQDSVDDAGEDVTWGVFVDDNGLRAVDGADVRTRFGGEDKTAEFRVREGYDQEELEVRVDGSYQNPDSSVIPVAANQASGPFRVFSFRIRARRQALGVEQIATQIEIKDTNRNGAVTAPAYDDVVDGAAVSINDQIFVVDTVRTRRRDGKTIATLQFDLDDDIDIHEYSSESVQLLVRFRESAGNYREGTIVRASVNTGGIRADNDTQNREGVAGRWHVLEIR